MTVIQVNKTKLNFLCTFKNRLKLSFKMTYNLINPENFQKNLIFLEKFPYIILTSVTNFKVSSKEILCFGCLFNMKSIFVHQKRIFFRKKTSLIISYLVWFYFTFLKISKIFILESLAKFRFFRLNIKF